MPHGRTLPLLYTAHSFFCLPSPHIYCSRACVCYWAVRMRVYRSRRFLNTFNPIFRGNRFVSPLRRCSTVSFASYSAAVMKYAALFINRPTSRPESDSFSPQSIASHAFLISSLHKSFVALPLIIKPK